MSSIVGPKITVELLAKAQTAELKKAIDDFKAGKIAVEDLEKKTKDLKNTNNDLNAAYKALQQSSRVHNFELREGIRVLSSFTSMARDLNQVWQSTILRNIEGTQTTVAQREAFEDLSGQMQNLASAIVIFGAEGDVGKAMKSFVGDVGDLSSVDIQKIIDQAEKFRSTITDPEQLKKWDEFISKLKQVKQETITEEEAKKWEDFFGLFTNIATAAGSIGTFALKLSEIGVATRALNAAIVASPSVLAFLAAVAAFDTAQETLTGESVVKEVQKRLGVENPHSVQGSLEAAFAGEEQAKKNEIARAIIFGETRNAVNDFTVNIQNAVFSTAEGIQDAAAQFWAEIQRQAGQKAQ